MPVSKKLLRIILKLAKCCCVTLSIKRLYHHLMQFSKKQAAHFLRSQWMMIYYPACFYLAVLRLGLWNHKYCVTNRLYFQLLGTVWRGEANYLPNIVPVLIFVQFMSGA